MLHGQRKTHLVTSSTTRNQESYKLRHLPHGDVMMRVSPSHAARFRSSRMDLSGRAG